MKKEILTKQIMKNIVGSKVIILLMLIASFLFAMFHLQDLPFYMYGWDDFQLIYQSIGISFGEIFSHTFFHPLNLYQGFLHQGILQRSVHGFFIKLSYLVGGLEPSFYYILRSVFYSLTGVLIYLFTKKMTRDNFTAISAGALYYSLPVIFDGLRWIGDAEVFSQFFLVLALYLFLKFYGGAGKTKYIGILLVFLAGILSIKARESGVIVIAVLAGFLLLKIKDWKKNKEWWIAVILLSLYLIPAFLTFLTGGSEQGSLSITADSIKSNFKHMLFYNPYTRIKIGEQLPVIFSLKQYFTAVPGSILGSIGFFLAWYSIIMLSLFLLWRKNLGKRFSDKIRDKKTGFLNDYFIMALLWSFFSALLLLLYVFPGDYSNIRYAGIGAVPLLVVIMPFCYFMTQYISKQEIKHISKYISKIFMVVILLSIIVNVFFTSVYLRGGIGSRQMGMEKIAKTITSDFYNQSFNNAMFFAITEHSGEDEYIPCMFSSRIPLSDMTVTNVQFLSITHLITEENINESLSKYGVVYIASFSEPKIIGMYPQAILVEEIMPCSEGLYCYLKELVKKQGLFKNQIQMEPKFYVYKIVEDISKSEFSRPVKIVCKS